MPKTNTEVVFLYVTAPDADVADQIAETVIADKCAACVNILPGMRSVYEWGGKVECAEECVLIVKTTAAAAPAARDAIINAHPFDTPCVAALPVDPAGSSTAFLDWICAETKRN
ncbi:MAG: divalent-cation tolerance protein CutA [Marinicaulis sp.]|nr:divalent-cation tolerance protein CutA [Marinicaulis sp.]NNE40443.1 divalent-cation tolerance protein CutA [Marinicaulis sp.]NNL88544.1 divalent-cation tolerance protein CutA [Marinicaulis sp.]